MTIHTGDCLDVMRGMPADSVDAVVTDPPYGLEFMGKGWDKFGAGFAVGGSERFKNSPPLPAFGKAGTPFQAWCEAWGREALRVTKPGGYLLAFGGTRTHHRLVCGLEDAGWIIRDELTWVYASGFPKGKANLKPAHEPIVLARKPGPLRPLGIEECRIAATDKAAFPVGVVSDTEAVFGNGEGRYADRPRPGDQSPAGRWPSNLLLSDPALFDEPNPEVVGSGATTTSGDGVRRVHGRSDWEGGDLGPDAAEWDGDTGGYSRFFIVPKSSRADREPVVRGQLAERNPFERGGPSANYEAMGSLSGARENAHPTVKPVDLMRHLIRLVTPPGGTVLDCFAGSGSTLIAAELEGFPWIGIEQDASYVAIAEARLNGTQRGLGLDVPAPTSTKKGRARPDSKIPDWPTAWKDENDPTGTFTRGVRRDGKQEPAA